MIGFYFFFSRLLVAACGKSNPTNQASDARRRLVHLPLCTSPEVSRGHRGEAFCFFGSGLGKVWGDFCSLKIQRHCKRSISLCVAWGRKPLQQNELLQRGNHRRKKTNQPTNHGRSPNADVLSMASSPPP